LTAEQTSGPEPQDEAVGAAQPGTPEGAATAVAEDKEGSAATADDRGGADAPVVVSADPSPEAAVGPSGANPLGDAASVADRVADAVRPALESRAAHGDEGNAPRGELEGNGGAIPVVEGLEGEPAAEPADLDGGADAPPAEPVEARAEPTTMEELLGEQTGNIRSFKHGDVVEGTVVRIDKDEILVDIGAKSEGVVSNRELYGRHGEGQPQLNIGDTVLVYVLQPESNEGHVVLSLRRAGLERKWRAMQEQFESGAIIEAPVIDHNKGGLIVDCGIRGFVPISQIVDFPRRPQNDQPRDAAQEIAEKLQPFVGRKLRLKILEVNRKANRLILSEKVALYEERREKRDELFSNLRVGQKVRGTIRSIAPFGVFVDLGGIDGLVHKSELSWNKVNNPEAGYKVGDEVEAEVIDINHERGRISLSIRRLQPDPWHSTVADFKVGDVIDGTVTKIVNFGAFVRVRDGLEGLIHISELSHQRVAHPADVVHEGQRLRLKIISLDSERHRLGLSLKQAEEPPPRPAEQPRERRARPERAYDPSQAVQEPEGGIDNTLAAAFAQVRQQVEESEQARAAPSAEEVADTLQAAGGDAGAPAPETADAPALEVPPGDASGTSSGDEAAVAPSPVDEAVTTTAESVELAAVPTATEEPPAAPEAPVEPPAVPSAPAASTAPADQAGDATSAQVGEPAEDTVATPAFETTAEAGGSGATETAVDDAGLATGGADRASPEA
jgi:small subunit ribosomal protein S1